jgi:hypothetical protein
MNTLDEIKQLVESFEVTELPFNPPSSDKRWNGKVRVLLDGWCLPVAVVAEFGTHWGDRVVVCEIVNLNDRCDMDINKTIAKARRRLAIEIMFYLKELNSDPINRRGPFEIPVGREGDSI